MFATFTRTVTYSSSNTNKPISDSEYNINNFANKEDISNMHGTTNIKYKPCHDIWYGIIMQ